MWELDYKESWGQRINAFKLWCWRRLLRVPWTARSNQSILKEIHHEYSLERLTLKLQYFGHLMQKSCLIGKDPDVGKDWRQEKGTTEDEVVGWHHRLDTWVWAISGSWWWTEKAGVLQSMGLQRVIHDWATELTEPNKDFRIVLGIQLPLNECLSKILNCILIFRTLTCLEWRCGPNKGFLEWIQYSIVIFDRF